MARHLPVPATGDNERCRGERDGESTAHVAIGLCQAEACATRDLGSGDPLEQVAVADVQAKQRATDGVSHQPCLIRKEDDLDAHLANGQQQVGAEGTKVAA